MVESLNVNKLFKNPDNPLSSLDLAIISQSKKDIRSYRSSDFGSAVIFWFCGGGIEDEAEVFSLRAICNRNGFDADSAARRFFNSLPEDIRRRVKDFLGPIRQWGIDHVEA